MAETTEIAVGSDITSFVEKIIVRVKAEQVEKQEKQIKEGAERQAARDKRAGELQRQLDLLSMEFNQAVAQSSKLRQLLAVKAHRAGQLLWENIPSTRVIPFPPTDSIYVSCPVMVRFCLVQMSGCSIQEEKQWKIAFAFICDRENSWWPVRAGDRFYDFVTEQVMRSLLELNDSRALIEKVVRIALS